MQIKNRGAQIFFFLFLVIILSPVFAQTAFAQQANNQLLPLGAECFDENDDTCASNDCEAAKDGSGKYYCVCEEDEEEKKDCEAAYGLQPGEKWTCHDGTDSTADLHYCTSNREGRTPPVPTGKKELTTFERLTNQTLAADEIKTLTSKPVLKINIPGLTFSDPQVVEGPDGGTYLNIPLIGEYIKAVYRYGIAGVGIIAVVIIINAGFLWMRSAGNPEVINAQKKSIEGAIIGLVIAVGSYTILFAINPRLTEFESLKVQYIKGEPIEGMFFTKETNYDSAIPTALSTPELEKLFNSYGSCFNLNPGILKGIALAESALDVSAGSGRKYQGLFQMDTAYCAGGLKIGKYPSSLGFDCVKSRIDPETNTASAAATIADNIRKIKRTCPSISVDDAMLLLYVGHNNGPAVMGHVLKNKGCTTEQMRLMVRDYYNKQPGKNRKGVDADYGEKKFNYGKKVVNAVRKYNVTGFDFPDGLTATCPKTTGQRALPGGISVNANPQGQNVPPGRVVGDMVCGQQWNGQKVLALGDSNTEYNLSYPASFRANCPGIPFTKIARAGENAGFLWNLIKDRNLREEGFKHIIVWAGVNNVNNAIPNLKKIYDKARADGLHVIAVTITPWKAFGNWSPANQVTTDRINDWIRSGAEGSLAGQTIIDVYNYFEDPNNPDELNPIYGRDRIPREQIHLNPQGQEELAKIIAQQAFR